MSEPTIITNVSINTGVHDGIRSFESVDKQNSWWHTLDCGEILGVTTISGSFFGFRHPMVKGQQTFHMNYVSPVHVVRLKRPLWNIKTGELLKVVEGGDPLHVKCQYDGVKYSVLRTWLEPVDTPVILPEPTTASEPRDQTVPTFSIGHTVVIRGDAPQSARKFQTNVFPIPYEILPCGEVLNISSISQDYIGVTHPAIYGIRYIGRKFVATHSYAKGAVVYVIDDHVPLLAKGQSITVDEDQGPTISFNYPQTAYVSKRYIHPYKAPIPEQLTHTTDQPAIDPNPRRNKVSENTHTETISRRTWEYMVFTVSSDQWVASLKDLGDLGWELCSDHVENFKNGVNGVTQTSHTLTLKRPIDPEPTPKKNKLATLTPADLESLSPIELGVLINRWSMILDQMRILSPGVCRIARDTMKFDIKTMCETVDCSRALWGAMEAGEARKILFPKHWINFNEAYKKFLLHSQDLPATTKDTA